MCTLKPRVCLLLEMERLLVRLPAEFPFGITGCCLQEKSSRVPLQGGRPGGPKIASDEADPGLAPIPP